MRFSNTVQRLEGSGYKSWDVHMRARQMKAEGADVLMLTIGDPDFETPPSIVNAAFESIRSGRTHYTRAEGEPELRAAIAAHHAQTGGQPITAANVAVVPGAQCGLYTAAMTVLQPGDEVIIPEPVYSTYEPVVGATGATPVFVNLSPASGFHLDPDALAAAVTPRTRAILVNTPHNPTGAMLGPDEVEALADICLRHDLWLITDEVYSHFAYDRPHLSPANLPELADRAVVISSLSKSHAMTGWRLGWVIGPEPFIAHVGRLLACMLFGAPPFIQDAALYALSHEVAEAEAMRQQYGARRALVCQTLTDAGPITCRAPEGGIYVLLDVRQTGMSGYEFGHLLLDKTGVALLPGQAFGSTLSGFLRISLTAPDADIQEACRRIHEFGSSL
ncbi:MAG: pyridoxal phosphate-dependent aminotransferase [Caldilineaceae bacterium]|nr:pyridoxal phosphate-dependent aminotransferase [Caldilineaceae bacterium]